MKLFKTRINLITLGIWLLLIFLWELSFRAGLINESFLTSPSRIVITLTQQVYWQDIGGNIWRSVSLLFTGITFGYLLSYLIFFIGFFWKDFLEFFRQVNFILKYIPPPLVIPIGILFLGVSEATQIFVIGLSVFFLYFNYLFGVLDKEESSYKILQNSWQTKPLERFYKFFLPISYHLSYRIIPGVIIWSIGVTVFVEIVLGQGLGIGSRIRSYQQTLAVEFLYASLLLLISIAFVMEKLFFWAFARFRWDFKKILATALLVIISVTSLLYQAYNFVGEVFDNRPKIVTYKAQVNLPLMVYIEEFNTLDLRLEFTSSGIEAALDLAAGNSVMAGYTDMPNALATGLRNQNLKIISHVQEKPNHPSLFLTSTRDIQENDFSALANSKIGYYPNNSVIQQGLDFVLFLNKANTGRVEYISSNDPDSLNQSLVTGALDGLLTLEPYVTIVEKELGIARVNPDRTALRGISFEQLPLAALMVDTTQFSDTDLKKLTTGINQSVQFIRDNTDSNKQASPELQDIMEKYDIHPDSKISYFDKDFEIDPQNLETIVKLVDTYAIDEFDFTDIDLNQFYLTTGQSQ